MILTDLFEAAERPAVEAKRMMREWRDSAATEKFALTIDSSGTNASNAFPVIRKAGTWYGGVFIPRGGDKKEAERMLGVNHRAKGWIKLVLAPSLEKLIEAGREVRISNKSTGNSNSTFYERVPVVKAGEVAAQLQAHTVEDDYMTPGNKRARVYWWVSASAETADITTINFNVMYALDKEPTQNEYFLLSMPKQDARALASKVVDFKKREPGKATLLAKQLLLAVNPDAKVNQNTVFAVGVTLGNASQFYKRADPDTVMKILGKYV